MPHTMRDDMKHQHLELPAGTWAKLHQAPPEEIEKFPEWGVATVTLFPPGALPSVEAFLNGPTCIFSAGNAWPDLVEMLETIERGLSDGEPVGLFFDTIQDAEACLAQLFRQGCRDRPVGHALVKD